MQGVIMNLLSYINGSMIHDTNYHLALALLKHLPEIQDLSLVEMAGNCFVSQATLHRFCKLIGYRNYSTLREACLDNTADQLDRPQFTSEEQQAFLATTMANLTDVDQFNVPEQVDRVLDCMHHSERVVCLGFEMFQLYAMSLQAQLVQSGLYIEVPISLSAQFEAMHHLRHGHTALLTTINGEYRDHFNEDIVQTLKESGWQLVVLTQTLGHPLAALADEVLCCGRQGTLQEAKYGVIRLYDYLAWRYHMCFCQS
mgnify:FL=1